MPLAGPPLAARFLGLALVVAYVACLLTCGVRRAAADTPSVTATPPRASTAHHARSPASCCTAGQRSPDAPAAPLPPSCPHCQQNVLAGPSAVALPDFPPVAADLPTLAASLPPSSPAPPAAAVLLGTPPPTLLRLCCALRL